MLARPGSDIVAAGPHPFGRAVALFLLAGVCLASLDATAKYLIQDHSPLLILWARYAGQTAFVTPFAWHRGGASFWQTRRLRLQVLRSSTLVVSTLCFYVALRYLPLAEGSAIAFMTPIFIIFMSGPLLGERPTVGRVVAAIGGFAGILILLRPGSAVFHPAAMLLIISALCSALYFILTRKLVDESAYTTLFYTALVGTVALTCGLPWIFAAGTVTWSNAAWLVLPGLFAGLGHWLAISAYMLAPASLLGPFSYMQILWATMYGYLVFGHLPDRWSAVGMGIVVVSGVLLALHERRGAR